MSKHEDCWKHYTSLADIEEMIRKHNMAERVSVAKRAVAQQHAGFMHINRFNKSLPLRRKTA